MSLRILENIAKIPLQLRTRSRASIVHNDVTVRTFATLPEKGKQFFERFLGNSMKPDDNMNELLDRDKEAEESLRKAGLKPADGEELDDEEWVEMFNKDTGEWNGPRYGEPTTYGDWQSKGRATDFK
mmetsp:Transcript_5921/g.7461  ORF Transcript_5921/g.7461 Transcript_5921/m.7461 type:complete len:127 (-) Transcript_5921:758-1138(-)|eukprot:CAMPEP_0204827722 /NCGR_PEP_ID=MMETSP1346-20131115/5174_1 /ASSEMBLY_ACC=CAM_ASM_000771 /TAXON_ID=215587 /ORGANISM="Aplanochytrium stocchinoi, Strain GSBS06" /LENGTH=126 /DNA_ID=CAMNT_0051956269 /DNA_START=130 /DNA_END=510 /DNA_ORIENTATION=-